MSAEILLLNPLAFLYLQYASLQFLIYGQFLANLLETDFSSPYGSSARPFAAAAGSGVVTATARLGQHAAPASRPFTYWEPGTEMPGGLADAIASMLLAAATSRTP